MAVAPRQRLTRDERHEIILAAARTVFARHGFHGAGTAEIARVAGCSEPMLYKHFPSKQALFAAVLVDATAQLKQRIHAMLDDCDSGLEQMVRMVGVLSHDPVMIEVSRLRMLAITLADEPEIRSALEQSVSEMRRRVVGSVQRMQEMGTARADIDADQIGWLWLGFVLAAGFRMALEGPQVADQLPQIPQTLLALLRTPNPEEVAG
jgi:AcrR family transcriptional regulator